MKARIDNYAEALTYAQDLYARVLARASNLAVNVNGEVAEEVENLRGKLRFYDLALKACRHYCQNVIKDLAEDMDSLEAHRGTLLSEEVAGDMQEILVIKYSEFAKLLQSCKTHASTAERAQKILKVASEEQHLRRLKLLFESIHCFDD